MKHAKHEARSMSESLKISAANRKALIKNFGFVPNSVLKLSYGQLSESLYRLQCERIERAVRNSTKSEEKLRVMKQAGYKGSQTASNRKSGRGTLAVSTMSAELVDFFVKYYAKPGDVYLDPFAGHGIRMQVAKLRGLHYHAYDLCAEFFDFMQLVRQRIDDKVTQIRLYHADSRTPDKIKDNSGDFCFTSPPYWDIEYYGDDERQLGRGTYAQFLDSMQQVAAAWLPKFKSGAIVVVNVNDFRKDKVFYSYHSDLIQRFVAAGWLVHDQWIVEGLIGGMARAFAVDFNLQKIAPKAHEYATVFRKR